MPDKLVSIVIPIYGVEKFIVQCATSLFEQTYKNIQYIFVNDCTKDNSVQLLKQVMMNYPNRVKQVKIVEKQHNEGLSLARKTGMEHVEGEYVMLVDSDDWLEVTMVEQMVDAMESQKVDVVYSDYYKNGTEQKIYNCLDISDTETYIKCMFLLAAPAQTWNKIYRTELFENIKFPAKSMHEDLYINLQIMYHAKSIFHLSEKLYHYRDNPNSITHNYPLEQSIENLQLMRNFLSAYDMGNILPSYYSFLNYVKSFVLKRIRPLDKTLLRRLFDIDKASDKYIFQRPQFNKFPTQLYLFCWSWVLKNR